MKITIASVLVSLALASEISAGLISSRQQDSHNALVRRLTRQKRCVRRLQTLGAPAPSSSSSSAAPPAQTPAENHVQDTGNHNTGGGGGGGGGGSAPGTINVDGMNPPCGDPQASSGPTVDNGPNGRAEWLACDVRTTGWKPPPIFRQNVKYVDLSSTTGPGGVFADCGPFLDMFNHWGGVTGIPPILLASIATQESSCRPNVRGPNGEYGLMQITGEKCPSQDDSCLDPWTNIMIGAQYFARTVDEHAGGNLAQAMGMYNGWEPYKTTEFTARDGRTCGQRNNLDYLHAVFNGFMQGRNPRADPRMGTFFNTDC